MGLTDEARAKGRATAAANRKRRAEERRAGKINAPVQTAPAEDESALFDVEDAPEDVFPQEEDGALAKVFKKLGLKGDTSEKEYKPVPSAKLTKAQQSLYDSFAPLAIQAFIVCAGWAWSLMGPEYKVLAPSEEIAEKIVAPLMRIYARESKITSSLNPNHMDAAASLAALVGYAWTSVMLYSEIKQEKANSEPTSITDYASRNNGYTELRPSPLDTSENGHSNPDPGRNVTRSHSWRNGSNAKSDGTASNFDVRNLTESERRQYEALSVLRERDHASRARRSGHA